MSVLRIRQEEPEACENTSMIDAIRSTAMKQRSWVGANRHEGQLFDSRSPFALVDSVAAHDAMGTGIPRGIFSVESKNEKGSKHFAWYNNAESALQAARYRAQDILAVGSLDRNHLVYLTEMELQVHQKPAFCFHQVAYPASRMNDWLWDFSGDENFWIYQGEELRFVPLAWINRKWVDNYVAIDEVRNEAHRFLRAVEKFNAAEKKEASDGLQQRNRASWVWLKMRGEI